MRISTNQIFGSGLSSMQNALSQLNKTRMQMATGRQILTPADDPSGAAQSMHLSAAIKGTEQYQRNADIAQPKLEYEEAQLIEVGNVLQRVRELVVAGNSDTYNPNNRDIIAGEIRQMRDEIIALANSQDTNGEYLFAGTRLQEQPFAIGDDGRITYVGAEGPGAIRDIELNSKRRIATGDTGADVFMNIPERSGLRTEAVFAPGNSLIGVANVELKNEIENLDRALNSAGQTFRIKFEDDGGTLKYKVQDLDGNAIKDQNGATIGGTYVPNQPIEFAGRRVTLSVPTAPPTMPADGDEILSRPLTQVSIFQTLDEIATAFESAVSTDPDSREQLSQATSMALRNLDSGLERVDTVRASVGLRLSAIDTQTALNDERLVDLRSTRSDIADLDYAEAISRFQLQRTVLQAAQQTYVEVNKLSLFNFI